MMVSWSAQIDMVGSGLRIALVLVALLPQYLGCGGERTPSPSDGGAPQQDASVIDAADDSNPSTCPAMDEVPTHSAAIVVRNDRAQAIYVAQKDCAAIFEVKASDPTIAGKYPEPYPARGTTVVPRCSFPSRECTAFHLCDEQGYFAFELRSGQELSFTWPGTLHPIIDVPEECTYDAGRWRCEQCIETRAAKPSVYVVEADAWTDVPGCQSPGACPCQRFSDGTCRHRFTAVPPLDLHAETSFDFPAHDRVTVSFQ